MLLTDNLCRKVIRVSGIIQIFSVLFFGACYMLFLFKVNIINRLEKCNMACNTSFVTMVILSFCTI